MFGFLFPHAGFSAFSFHMPIFVPGCSVFVLPSFIHAESVYEFASLACCYSRWFFKVSGLEIKKMSGRKFATSYENLVATLKMLVAKLIEAI